MAEVVQADPLGAVPVQAEVVTRRVHRPEHVAPVLRLAPHRRKDQRVRLDPLQAPSRLAAPVLAQFTLQDGQQWNDGSGRLGLRNRHPGFPVAAQLPGDGESSGNVEHATWPALHELSPEEAVHETARTIAAWLDSRVN
jgi:hypothetical protein